jgi:glucans biosynthesis protein C
MNDISTAGGGIRERIHALDAARAIALFLGIVLHAAIAYIPGPSGWPIMDESRSTVPALAFYVIHAFRMLVFFVLAGFFGNMLIERVGTRSFLIDRWKRVAVPLLVFWAIVLTAIVAAIVWMVALKFGELPKESPPGPSFRPNDFPLTHLWFLWALILLYAFFVAARTLVHKLSLSRQAGRIAAVIATRIARWYAPLVLAIPLAFALYLHPKWMHWFGIPTPDKTLYGNAASWIAYGLAFAIGASLERHRESLQAIRNNTWTLLVVGVAAVFASVSHADVAVVVGLTHADSKKALSALLYAVAAWALCFAFLSLAIRFLGRASLRIRYCSAASYWTYIVHLPIVMFLQVVGSQWSGGWAIEWPLVIAATLALSLGSYHLFVRNTWVGIMLNGRRWRDMKSREAARIG